ncbi:MAG: type B 50S ribosomal protein L31 [Paramuribaculum intestinale]
MKKDIHPSNYREVVFKDMSNEEIFITRSTIAAKETIEVDGKTYPLVKLEITSASHPFFTGKQKLVDTAGRVDKFMSRNGTRQKKLIPRKRAAVPAAPCTKDHKPIRRSCVMTLCVDTGPCCMP